MCLTALIFHHHLLLIIKIYAKTSAGKCQDINGTQVSMEETDERRGCACGCVSMPG